MYYFSRAVVYDKFLEVQFWSKSKCIILIAIA